MTKWIRQGKHILISETGKSIIIFDAEATKAGGLFMQFRFNDSTLTPLSEVGPDDVKVYHELEALVADLIAEDENAELGRILISSVFASKLFLEGKLTPDILVNARDVGEGEAYIPMTAFNMVIGGRSMAIEVFDAKTESADILYSPSSR